ncbi:phage major capsid protein [uncultured Anaerofustis sp.]|uniref:phage major capsid protein n=1 Tax=uncultured Anaerofustis sp. TaxID=904996 RepID=UPI0025CF8E89|nr:phage major capsid protein [uncultured Anaerofustis sp.]
MSVTTTKSADQALKSYFLSPVRASLNEDSGPFFAMITRNSEDVEGGNIKMALQYGRHGGIGNRSEDGLLPTANARKYIQATWETKNLFAVLSISSKLIKASRTDKGSFANMLTAQMQDLLTDAKDNIRRQYLSDGSGKVTCIKKNDSTWVYKKGEATVNVENSKYFYPGQFIDIIDNSENKEFADMEALEIKDVDYKANTIILNLPSDLTVESNASGTVSADYIVFTGNKDMELTGIDSVFNSPNLYGIDRTANSWFNANKIAAEEADGAHPLTEMDMQYAIDLCEEQMGSTIDYIHTTYGGARAFQNLYQSYKRNIEYTDIKGGYKTMSFAGIPIFKERYLKEGTMDFISTKDFSLFQLDDFDWMQKDGGILHRVDNTPVYQAVLEMYCDIGCAKPKGQARLFGFDEM